MVVVGEDYGKYLHMYYVVDILWLSRRVQIIIMNGD